jgi:hypothetical protein
LAFAHQSPGKERILSEASEIQHGLHSTNSKEAADQFCQGIDALPVTWKVNRGKISLTLSTPSLQLQTHPGLISFVTWGVDTSVGESTRDGTLICIWRFTMIIFTHYARYLRILPDSRSGARLTLELVVTSDGHKMT